jgi:predicted ATPase
MGALHRLLHQRLGCAFPRPVLRRIHATSGGNPFYAVEIARALETGELSSSPSEPLAIPPSLDDLVRGRIESLPPGARHALAVSAALGDPTLAVVGAAVGADAAELLSAAVDGELIRVDADRIRFAHPLLASAAYGLAGSVERRELHRRLASVVEDVEEQARHLALAVTGPDAAVAAALESAAAHARARGAAAAAAELSDSARRLTPSHVGDEYQRRAVTTAGYRFLSGDAAGARALLHEAVGSARTGQERAEALVMLARVEKHEGSQLEAAELLRGALGESGFDDGVRAEAAQGYASTLFYLRETLDEALRYAELGVDLATRAGAATVHAEAVSDKGLIEAALGRMEAEASLSLASVLPDEPTSPIHPVPRGWYRGYVLTWRDRPAEAVSVYRPCWRRQPRTPVSSLD